MAFPASFIDELVARNPIEDVVGQYVNLKRSGGNLFGLCPFHGEKTASFLSTINLHLCDSFPLIMSHRILKTHPQQECRRKSLLVLFSAKGPEPRTKHVVDRGLTFNQTNASD